MKVRGRLSQPHPEVPLVNIGYTYDNSDGRGELIAERESKTRLIVHDPIRWKLIEETAQWRTSRTTSS